MKLDQELAGQLAEIICRRLRGAVVSHGLIHEAAVALAEDLSRAIGGNREFEGWVLGAIEDRLFPIDDGDFEPLSESGD